MLRVKTEQMNHGRTVKSGTISLMNEKATNMTL